MTLDELNQLHDLLQRLDAEAESVPDDQLVRLASACSVGSSALWAELEARNEGTSGHSESP